MGSSRRRSHSLDRLPDFESRRSERYTRVEIVGIAARSPDATRALFKAIAANLEAVGVPRKDTRIS